MTSHPVLLTTSQAARRLDVHAATVRRWIASGRLPAVRLPSGQSKVREDVVEELLTAGKEQARPAVPEQRSA